MPIRSSIAGLGVYTPERQVPIRDRERVANLRRRIPIERITGIRQVSVAAENEFSIDLAQNAALRCLASAGVDPADVDLLISCSICRYDRPDFGFVFEPCTAFRLKQRMGLDNATAFDISNACAGMFTGMLIADAAIRAGNARRVLVVSGEYISHIAECAAKEIASFSDARMACLTLGDGGAAVLMAPTEDEHHGFEAMTLYSVPEHSDLCVAQPSAQTPGGAIMTTKSTELSRAMVEQLRDHIPSFLAKAGRTKKCIDWVIPHQTSIGTVKEAAKAINSRLGYPLCTTESVVLSLHKFGNTATTSHMLALHDNISSGRIGDGDTVLFSVNASGLTVGSALYRLGDLPSRTRNGSASIRLEPPTDTPKSWSKARIAGTAFDVEGADGCDGRKRIVDQALAEAGVSGSDVDLVIFSGVYRHGFVMEPCLATMIAKHCGLGSNRAQQEEFLAFDVFAGPSGFLHALSVAGELMTTAGKQCAVIVTGDMDPNVGIDGAEPFGIEASIGVVVLRADDQGRIGPVHAATVPCDVMRFMAQRSNRTTICSTGTPVDREITEPAIIQSVARSLREAKRAIDLVLLPNQAEPLREILMDRFGICPHQIVSTPDSVGNAFSADLCSAVCEARSQGRWKEGGLCLFIGFSDIGEATTILYGM